MGRRGQAGQAVSRHAAVPSQAPPTFSAAGQADTTSTARSAIFTCHTPPPAHLGHVEEHGPLAQSVAFRKSSVAARHARACSCRQQAAVRRRYQVRSTEVSLGQGRRYLGLRHAYTNHTCCLAARKSCPSPWAAAAANAHLSLPAGSLPPRQGLGSIPAGRATDTSAPTFASTDAPACQQAATARSQHHAPSSHSHRWCRPSQPHPRPPRTNL